jgi:excinuclease ABC subunit C
MTLDDIKKKKIPDSPGVYFFIGPRKKILYIGKATSLKSRVRSYFDPDIRDIRSPLIEKMVHTATTIDWRETDSVLEALILESNLIKTWKPPYNTDGKDDKSDWYVVVTCEEYPRVLLVRGTDVYQRFEDREIKKVFGPFPHARQLSEALKIIRRIFPFFDTKHPIRDTRSRHEQGKIAFNQSIGVYPSFGSKTEYQKTIRRICLLFESKKPKLLQEIARDMRIAVRKENFETAEMLKRQMFALTHLHDVALITEDARRPLGNFRIESYDIAHLGGSAMVGVMVVIEDGVSKKSDYRKFKIRSVSSRSDDTQALYEVLRRRFAHEEWQMPRLIVLDGSTAQLHTGKRVLQEYGYEIPIVSVVKDERHRPREILGDQNFARSHEKDILLANAEAHRFAVTYHRSTQRKSFQ